jgi:hypothetical protein
MKRRKAWGLAQLLLLAAALPCFQASRFDSYTVHPKSYLDTLKTTRSDQMLSANAVSAGCDPSAPAGSCQHSTSHLLGGQQPAATLSTGSASTWNVGITSAGVPSDPSKSLQQRAANPLRLQPPYNVCVSSWDPMVRCTNGADQSEYKGKLASRTKALIFATCQLTCRHGRSCSVCMYAGQTASRALNCLLAEGT